MSVQYVTDQEGKKTGVLLQLEDYEALMEDMADLALVAERRDDSTVSHEEVMNRLKQDGYL